MADDSLYMIAGLGNPGEKYVRTRHNFGFMVIDQIFHNFSFPDFKAKSDALFSKGRINGKQILLVKPHSFMNRSGIPIQQLSSFFKITPSNIIVVHDDLDLPFEMIKIAKNRGHGGHNGIRSIINALGTKDFVRIRMGVGHPRGEKNVTGHVLGIFSRDEEPLVQSVLEKSSDACIAVLKSGLQTAMNSFN